MNVLFVTLEPINSTSSATATNVVLINELHKLGYNTDVLSMSNNAYIKNNPKEFINNKINIKFINGNNTYEKMNKKELKLSNKKTKVVNLIKFLYRKLCVYNYTYLSAKKTNIDILSNRNYDLVISTSDPKTSHLLVKKLLKKGLKTNKWIQYWGDPLSGDITKKTIWPEFVLKKIEKNLLKDADKIIYVSPFTCKEAQNKFSNLKDKMKFVPIPSINKKNFNVSLEGKMSLIYCGSYDSSIRNILPLYEAVKFLTDKFDMKVVGNSDLKLSSYKNIEIIPPVEKRKALEFEENGDIYVCVLNKEGTQIPGKLYHYATTNKPILIIAEEKYPEIIEYVKSFKRFVISINTVDSITDALNYLYSHRSYNPNTSLAPNVIIKDILS